MAKKDHGEAHLCLYSWQLFDDRRVTDLAMACPVFSLNHPKKEGSWIFITACLNGSKP